MKKAIQISARSRQGGNSIVEFALAFTFLFSIMAGTFQFGYTFYIYNGLKSAVREGARYASLRTYDTNSSGFSSSYGNAVKRMTVYGNVEGTGNPVVKGLTVSNVDLRVNFVSGVPATVQVSIKNYDLDTVFKRFRFNKPLAVFPYSGRYAPDGV